MFSGKDLFNKAKDIANKAVDVDQKIAGDITDRILNKKVQKNAQNHSIYEAFVPTLGVGVQFTFTENSLIYGSEEYPYSDLGIINIINPPAKLSDGLACTDTNSGKTLRLVYNQNQSERFSKMLLYANEKISSTIGKEQKYIYLLQTKKGIKIEVYEEYIILYCPKEGISNLLFNTMSDGGSGKTISFTDLSIQLEKKQDGETYLIIGYTNGNDSESISVELESFNIEKAQSIITYIHEKPKTKMTEVPETVSETWDDVSGTERIFTINGKALHIPVTLDIYNSYRQRFQQLALACSEAARNEYDKKVINLVTFLEFFPPIYGYYLGQIIPRVIEICIFKGIYTETEDSILEKHLQVYTNAWNVYETTVESIELTLQKNQNQITGLMGNIPRLVGGGFGTVGAVKGIAKAEIFNTLADKFETKVVKGAENLNNAQQQELYERINPDDLFTRVFADYWNTYELLVNILNSNGENIWLPTEELKQQCNNIFHNISKPVFPKEKILDVLLDIISKNPYNPEYFEFLANYCGETNEVVAVRKYFGY